MNRTLRGCPALAAAVLCLGPLRAMAVDVEPNDTLAAAQVVVGSAAGETLIAGELFEIPFTFPDGATTSLHTLAQGQVNVHDIAGLPAGAAALVFLDNDLGFVAPDTVMRALDEMGGEVAFDDDGSVFGNGVASGFLTTVNSDGSLHLEVTGYADYDFDGIDDIDGTPHIEFGNYELLYQIGPFGDVDFFRITGLAPGTKWSAETVAADGQDPLDTILTLYDEGGVLIDQHDDIDFDAGILLSRLTGTVPPGGEVLLAVSSFPDYTNVGGHVTIGNYGLLLSYEAIPEPSGTALAVVGFLATMGRVSRGSPRAVGNRDVRESLP